MNSQLGPPTEWGSEPPAPRPLHADPRYQRLGHVAAVALFLETVREQAEGLLESGALGPTRALGRSEADELAADAYRAVWTALHDGETFEPVFGPDGHRWTREAEAE